MKPVFFHSDEFKTGDYGEDISYKRKALKSFLAVSVVLFAYCAFDSAKAGEPFQVLLSSGGLLASLSGLFLVFRKSELGKAKQILESKNTELQKTVFDLNKTKKKLEDLNRDLEIMVAKRTVELSEQNNRLLKEIRERQRVEKRLLENEAKYRQIVENVPVAILEFDLLQNRFVSINREVSRVLGYSEDELLKMGPFDLLHEECKETVKNRLKAAVAEDEEPPPFEYRVKTKDDKTVWVYGGTKLVYESGEPVRALTVAQNVTDRKALEHQFLQVQKQEALGTLAAGVAHNFNNLMMGIQGNAAIACHMLQEKNPARKYLANIEKIVDEASLLAERFLNFARGGKHESRVTDVKELVLKTAAVFRGARKDVRLFTFFEDDLRTVEVDPGQIEQVLLDVLVNSWQAMPKGGDVFLDVRMFDTQAGSDDSKLPDQMPEGKYVRICIADEGLGMDKATTERIFDPFFFHQNGYEGHWARPRLRLRHRQKSSGTHSRFQRTGQGLGVRNISSCIDEKGRCSRLEAKTASFGQPRQSAGRRRRRQRSKGRAKNAGSPGQQRDRRGKRNRRHRVSLE